MNPGPLQANAPVRPADPSAAAARVLAELIRSQLRLAVAELLDGRRGDPAMQWEYMTVIVTSQFAGTGETDPWKARYINGQEIPDWKTGPPAHQLMNQWGAEGWELVSITPLQTGNLFRTIFKRPLAAQASVPQGHASAKLHRVASAVSA